MASPKLLPAQEAGEQSELNPEALDRVSGVQHARKSAGSTGERLPGEGGCAPARGSGSRGRCLSAPRTAQRRAGAEGKLCPPPGGEEKLRVCCDEELETSFTYIDENVNLRLASPETGCKTSHRPVRNGEPCSETLPELSFMSEDDLSFGEGSGSSVDYGFISAVTFLVTGISLVSSSDTAEQGDISVRPSVRPPSGQMTGRKQRPVKLVPVSLRRRRISSAVHAVISSDSSSGAVLRISSASRYVAQSAQPRSE
ncbi:uncharacterized protein LOC122831764 isoform X2 [Gambusia affinis]|uniref:uncharacterized protein LOC122831764 isoform X2 n=1 Tax=Gambusia affinis TaxID=33528 RepID=UPI001CDCB47A|nr:uncharacterized protein LOC122831764 isoform X2 [Gambusia affinis]